MGPTPKQIVGIVLILGAALVAAPLKDTGPLLICGMASLFGLLLLVKGGTANMTCPRGHKPPIVQYLKPEKIYVCTRCLIEWKKVPRGEAMRQAKGGS